MAMNHDVVIPADGFAAILVAFADIDDFFCGKYAIRRITPAVLRLRRMRKAELMRRKTALVLFDLGRPLATVRFIEHVLRGLMVVNTNAIPKPSAEKRGDRLTEQPPGEIPQGHLNAAC